MITSLLEFYFSKHYFYDSDNRFKLRVLNANILNNLTDMTKAKSRFVQAMSYLALEKLDGLSTNGKPVAIVFGGVMFAENGKMQTAKLEVDKSEGNTYVAIVTNENVVTLLLFPNSTSNQDIFDKVRKDTSEGKVQIEKLINLKGETLDLNSQKREAIVIDLDIDIKEFNKQFPVAKLKNNVWSKSAFAKEELEDIMLKGKEREKEEMQNKVHFSPSAIPDNLKSFVPDKEFVIYEGMRILVKIGEEYKWKTIKKLNVSEKGDKREFTLEFENTLKPMPLTLGTIFVINPVMKNEEYLKLLSAFNLNPEDKLSFVGPIVKFNFYKKGKGGSDRDKLGVIINSRMWITTPD